MYVLCDMMYCKEFAYLIAVASWASLKSVGKATKKGRLENLEQELTLQSASGISSSGKVCSQGLSTN